ncbi:hypothetical protein ACFL2V_18145, partial [Pseudomonadota bacterium]
ILMKQNLTTKKLVGVGAVALFSIAMSGAASAVTFNATATVQNALTVVNAADMNLGTVFATTASTTAYRVMTLAADGTMGSSSGDASLTLLGLGGQAAASATVAVGTNTAFTVTLPTAEISAAGLDGTSNIATIQGLTDQIEVAAADPAVARFQLLNFTVGSVTSGTASANCIDLTDSVGTCTLTPDFGVSSVGFNVGATIMTDVDSAGAGDQDTYQAAAYSGTFDVTASY